VITRDQQEPRNFILARANPILIAAARGQDNRYRRSGRCREARGNCVKWALLWAIPENGPMHKFLPACIAAG
jgi:hypothetical protein